MLTLRVGNSWSRTASKEALGFAKEIRMKTWAMFGMGALAMTIAGIAAMAAMATTTTTTSRTAPNDGPCRCSCCCANMKPEAAPAAHLPVKEPARGLVAYYPFDGDARDASGHGNDGQPSGDVKYVDGVFGKAVKFGGVDSPGHIRIANSDSLKFADAMSLSFWVNVEGDAAQTWMDGSARKVPLAGQVVVAKSGDRTGFMIKRGQEGNDVRGIDVTAHGHTEHVAGLDSKETVPLHQWVHVVLIASPKGTRLYEGGELVAKDPRCINLAEVNGEDMYVGIQAGNGSCLPWWGPLNGAVDELRVYDRELTDNEVRDLAKRQ